MIFDNLNKLAPREKAGLVVALLCILGVLLDYLVVSRVVRAIDDVKAEIERESMELEYNVAVLSRKQSVERQYEGVSGILHEAAVAAEAIDRMKGEIDEIARNAGIAIISMEHREPKSSPNYDEYIVEVGKFESTMEQLVRFLHDLHVADGMLRVSQIKVSADEQGGPLTGSVLITKVMMRSENKEAGDAVKEEG